MAEADPREQVSVRLTRRQLANLVMLIEAKDPSPRRFWEGLLKRLKDAAEQP